MNDAPTVGPGRSRVIAAGLAMLALVGAAAWYLLGHKSDHDPPPPVRTRPSADLAQQINRFCSGCHLFPPPNTFPRAEWKDQVERMYHFFGMAGLALQPPPIEQVVQWYQERAPEKLPPAVFTNAPGPGPVRFERVSFPGPPHQQPPAISNVNLVHLGDAKRLDVLATDMRRGQVLRWQPYRKSATPWKVLYEQAEDFNPAHVELIDLDRDGVPDILVANLGSFKPTDRRCGSVEWLRGNKDGTYKRFTLLADVGRVADVQAADFRGVGKLDLIVAVFGWQKTGEIVYLENHTTDWSKPRFVPRVLDERHGTIHVPILDLDKDGRPDFIALISQEHETVVAFLNRGAGRFEKKTIFQAAHPGYGSSGIQVVDLNGDGEPDLLYTNGDTLDTPYLLKPYHGVQWLENPGRGRFPWIHHPLTPFYGVHRAVAADFRGNGKKDIVSVSFLPPDAFPLRERLGLDAVLYLKDLGKGRYERHSLETASCDHVTCAAGDVFGSGRIDFVTALFTATQTEQVLTVWKNLGPAKK